MTGIPSLASPNSIELRHLNGFAADWQVIRTIFDVAAFENYSLTVLPIHIVAETAALAKQAVSQLECAGIAVERPPKAHDLLTRVRLISACLSKKS